jgi:hypothetical protein
MFASVISVGTNMGDVMVWELGSRERIALRSFKVWEAGAWSVPLQVWLRYWAFFFFACHVHLMFST